MSEIERLHAKKKATIEALRSSLEYCGYDFDSAFDTKSRKRFLTDIRSIVFDIYQKTMSYSYAQIGIDFNWNRGAVKQAIIKANDLRGSDRAYTDLYDAIEGAYINAVAKEEETVEQ